MKWRIRKCPQCRSYTLKSLCPKCGSNTIIPHPPRFSPDDKYVEYRIRIKYLELIEKLNKFKDYSSNHKLDNNQTT